MAPEKSLTIEAVASAMPSMKPTVSVDAIDAPVQPAKVTSAGTYKLRVAASDDKGVAQVDFYLKQSIRNRIRDEIRRARIGEVASAAWRYLDPDRMTTVIVGDEDRVSETLSVLGLGPAQTVTPPRARRRSARSTRRRARR